MANNFLNLSQIVPQQYISQSLKTYVTYRPTSFGEYRCMIKVANSASCIDDVPDVPPDEKSGMFIYAVGRGADGTPGQTNRWEIYIGKNKKLQYECYYGEHREFGDDGGIVSAQPSYQLLSTHFAFFAFFGLLTSYNSYDGVAIVDTVQQGAVSPLRNVGVLYKSDGQEPQGLQSCYFDILVF